MGPSVALSSGAAIPLVGFGTWQLEGESAYQSVRVALDAGYRHLDTATTYGNEAEIGRALRDSGIPREDIFLVTKMPGNAAGREAATLKASLDALGTDYVDLWLIHWPPSHRWPVGLWQGRWMWRQFRRLRDAGLVRSIGVSNYSIDQIDKLVATSGEAPAVNQIRWAPRRFDPRVLDEHRRRHVVVEGHSALQQTDLSLPAITGIADRHGVSPAQIVLRWHVQHQVVAIPKSATKERIVENFAVFDFELSPAEMGTLDALAR